MLISGLTIEELHCLLQKKEVSALEITQFFLKQITEKENQIHAFLSLNADFAIKEAEAIDEKIKNKEELDVLAGIPLAVKDNILVEGLACTAGSKLLEKYIAPYNATVVERLKRKGAIILGKTNLDEFAMGASTENSAFGPTFNPYDLKRVPGGSSGGSAAAVSAEMSVYSLGSDTGGSIRQPASFCGVVGLKPTYGAVSRYGLIAMASSFDQIGPLAKSIADCRIVFKAIRGKDEMDSTSVNLNSDLSVEEFKGIKGLRIGMPEEYFAKGVEPGVKAAVIGAIKKYQEAGAQVIPVSLPYTKYAVPCYYIIVPSEISANLARYDGIKYGFSQGDSLADVYLKSRGDGLGSEVKRRIMLGTYALSAGYYDAYYLRAQKVRTLIRKDFEKVFAEVDVLMTPVSPTTAFKIGEKTQDPLSMYLADIFTAPVSLAGLPALSLPCGLSKGLPVGLQIIGQPFAEDKVLAIGELFGKL
ncbi:MAG: Asp-tRNA(Asn)/Glu-tRNA(Gln) amidotransferase subunit GatA [bacterium]